MTISLKSQVRRNICFNLKKCELLQCLLGKNMLERYLQDSSQRHCTGLRQNHDGRQVKATHPNRTSWRVSIKILYLNAVLCRVLLYNI